MRFSKLLAPTLRENPAEAEVVSHQLLVRAGYIRRLANGVYSYLPMMWRVLRKVEQVVREEMDRAGAQELLMPILQPAEVWQASGRWDVYGDLMMRVKDRHDREYGLAPTAEEVITDIATKEVRSYRQLPVNLYQIQTKYRDEIRPRFGLLRGREFIMKDAYSFHITQDDLAREYDVMAETYTRIFDRCGLETRMVRSDSGAIGGSVSHEYMVLTRISPGEQESGENDVFYCDHCDYAANAERAESILPTVLTNGSDLFPTQRELETPNCDSIETLSKFLDCPASLICKALLYIADEKRPYLVLIRGDLEVEETKLINTVQANEIRLATAEEVEKFTGSVKGFVGVGTSNFKIKERNLTEVTLELKVQLNQQNESFMADGDLWRYSSPEAHRKAKGIEQEVLLPLLLDASVLNLKNFIVAFNKPNFHLVGFNWLSEDVQYSGLKDNGDIPVQISKSKTFSQVLQDNLYDLRRARVGDTCPECKSGQLEMTRGIEVGNIFQLGTKYSKAMNATYTAEDGTEQPFIMGCYGIGVSRTAAAAIERFHDKNGIIWPMAIAPYHAVVVPVNVQDETQMKLALQIYEELGRTVVMDEAAGIGKRIEVVLDDRDERAGVKFKDADLIGYPIRITAGKKAVEGLLEVKMRDWEQPKDMPVDEVVAFVREQRVSWKPQLQRESVPVA